MTTTTTPTVVRGPVDLTARWFLTVQLNLARWFWGIAVVVLAVALAIYAQVGTVQTSVAQYAMQAVMWVPFSVFIGLGLAYLPMHVSSGLTRRTLSHGALIAAAGTAVLYGGAFAVLLLVERAVYAAFGWHWSIGGLTPDTTTTAAYLTATAATFLLSYVAGLLVGVVYLRGGGWWGTLTLPLTVGPVVGLAALVTQDSWPFDGRAQGLVLDAVLGVAVAVVMAVVFDRLVRGAAVPPKR